MFDIAWSELLLIAVVALIFIGPKELPAVLHKLGMMTAKLRRAADDFRRQFEDSMRDSGYGDLQKNIQDLRSLNPANQLRSTLEGAINQNYMPRPAPIAEQAAAQPPTPAITPETFQRLEEQARANAFAAAAASETPAQGETAKGPETSELRAAPEKGTERPVDAPAKERAAPVA
ncbi:MAG: Sec-independent protein translocase protein TatB [Rhodomicrobium sp.]